MATNGQGKVLSLLAKLAKLDRERWDLEAPFQAQIDELQVKINYLVGQQLGESAGTRAIISKVEAQIREEGVKSDHSVKDTESGYQCVYVPAKRKWDGDKLEGFAAAHPEVLQCSTMGQPSVQLRRGK